MFVLLKILYLGTLVPIYSAFVKFWNITFCTRFAVGSKEKTPITYCII